jgi:hypothetical protein
VYRDLQAAGGIEYLDLEGLGPDGLDDVMPGGRF